VELLIVVAILLLLSTLALAVYNSNNSSDRMRSAARVAQSALLGAKDRALFARQPRGVRLVRDQSDPSLATGFVYLTRLDNRQYGKSVVSSTATVQILRPDSDNDGQGSDATSPDAVLLAGTGVDWASLDANGFLPYPEARVRIPAGTGNWYVLQPVAGQTAPPYYTQTRGSTILLTLSSPYVSPQSSSPAVVALDSSSPLASWELERVNDVLPFHEPIALPSGVVIDLDYSSPSVQSLWPAGSPSKNIDILFSPRGMVTGAVAGRGSLHFLLNRIEDASRNLNPIDPQNKGDKLVLTVNPQTGHVATYPIDTTDADQNGLADDLFRFAQEGKGAGQ
jgi:hypothetical protein